MRHRYSGILTALFAAVLLSISISNVSAQWIEDGAALCSAAGHQYDPTIVSDGAGGAIVTWRDHRSGNGDIYAQRVNASGEIQWTTDGVPICTATGHQWNPTIISDEAEGAIITWHDLRTSIADIYVQHIDASGAVQWTTNGVPLCTATGGQYDPTIVSDGAGGAIVAWRDQRSANYDVYAQRVNASGEIQWTANGVPLCTAAWNQTSPIIVSDGAGGAIVTWDDVRNATDWNIYAQRVNGSGAVQWLADGVALCTATGDQEDPKMVSDGTGGAIVTWPDSRSGNADVYAQRVSASGTVMWTGNGLAICAATGNQDEPSIVSNSSGDAVVTWQDTRGGGADIYAQQVDVTGSIGWTAGGVSLCTAIGGQYDPEVISDGSGGTIITWRDERNGNDDIYAQRADATGAAHWTVDGVALCTAAEEQYYPMVVSDGPGGAIVTWRDNRSGISFDIYTQRITYNGVVLGTLVPISGLVVLVITTTLGLFGLAKLRGSRRSNRQSV